MSAIRSVLQSLHVLYGSRFDVLSKTYNARRGGYKITVV